MQLSKYPISQEQHPLRLTRPLCSKASEYPDTRKNKSKVYGPPKFHKTN